MNEASELWLPELGIGTVAQFFLSDILAFGVNANLSF